MGNKQQFGNNAPLWPTKNGTSNPSGGGRTNNPPSKKQKRT
ncbi:hypothetical protein [Vibrio bivalvicida]|nr:hypothetical protein [Vibrio bivalvicida]